MCRVYYILLYFIVIINIIVILYFPIYSFQPFSSHTHEIKNRHMNTNDRKIISWIAGHDTRYNKPCHMTVQIWQRVFQAPGGLASSPKKRQDTNEYSNIVDTKSKITGECVCTQFNQTLWNPLWQIGVVKVSYTQCMIKVTLIQINSTIISHTLRFRTRLCIKGKKD